jgi:hypothetical protein
MSSLVWRPGLLQLWVQISPHLRLQFYQFSGSFTQRHGNMKPWQLVSFWDMIHQFIDNCSIHTHIWPNHSIRVETLERWQYCLLLVFLYEDRGTPFEMVCMHLKLLNVPQYIQCGTTLDGMKLIFDQAPSDSQQLHIVVSFGVGLGVSWTNLPHLPTHGQLWGGLTDIIDTLVTDFNWGCCFNHHSLRVCKVKRSIDSGIHNRLEPYFWMSAEVGMSVNTLYMN